MSTAVNPTEAVDIRPVMPSAPAARRDVLDAGLDQASRLDTWTFIAVPAPIVPAGVIAGAWSRELASEPAVAWSTRDLTLAGVGAAVELRGTGTTRWRDIVDAVPGLGRHDLGAARPRFIGGAAWAPGAADSSPWSGFGDAWFMLPRWTYVHERGRREASLVLAVRGARDTTADARVRWRNELAMFEGAWRTPPSTTGQPGMISIDRGDTRAWRDHVANITSAIGRGECAKIVAARACVVQLAGDARLAELLLALDERHPETVRVMVHPPGGGTLVAATPERLVRREGSVVSCDALAGTISRELGEAALLASAKDRNEHELVVRAIAGALRDVSAEVIAPEEPGIRSLRHVLHLHTPIRATLASPRHLLELAARLHPTPAMGGTPTSVACEWIAAREPAARGWYASPVGWFDLDGDGELAVAIRSGLVAGDRVHLYAGAGIVAGSDPERELAETDIKLRTLLGALGVQA